MLTQAPPNTGAGWYTMATGAWPGVHRFHQQHVPHQHPAAGQPHRRLRSRRAAGRDHRPVRGTRRQEGHPAGVGRRPERRINGPTVDFRSFFSGRGVTTNFVSPSDRANSDHLVRAAVRPGHAGRRDRLDRSARLLQPGQGNPHGACSTVGHRQVRPGRLHLRQHRRPPLNYDRVLFARNKNAADTGGRSAQRAGWPTSRSRSVGGALEGLTAACWSRSRR